MFQTHPILEIVKTCVQGHNISISRKYLDREGRQRVVRELIRLFCTVAYFHMCFLKTERQQNMPVNFKGWIQ